MLKNAGSKKVIEMTKRGERHEFIEVQGARVHVVRAGSGSPVVLLHGLTGSVVNWRHNIPVLASRAAVYAIDMVNMGDSARVPGLDPGLAATADRVVAAMDALGLARADIAAHSHGGAIALMLAARHPERVRSLMLFAPANLHSHVSDHLVRFYTGAIGIAFGRLVPFLPRYLHMIALRRMYGDPARIGPGTLEGYVTGLRVRGTIPHIIGILRNWFDEMHALDAVLPSLEQTKVLLVWGDRDRAVSLESGRILQGKLPYAELAILPGVGHVPFEERPDECNEFMLEWLERIERSRPKAQAHIQSRRFSGAVAAHRASS